jgi:hypothetical protein
LTPSRRGDRRGDGGSSNTVRPPSAGETACSRAMVAATSAVGSADRSMARVKASRRVKPSSLSESPRRAASSARRSTPIDSS